MPPELLTYDSARYLNTPNRQADYLNLAFEEDEGDGKAIAAALVVLARAQDLTDGPAIPAESRQALAEGLSRDGVISIASILRICRALGLDLTFHPHAAE